MVHCVFGLAFRLLYARKVRQELIRGRANFLWRARQADEVFEKRGAFT